MSHRVIVPDPVYERASELSDEKEMTLKEAIRHMCREGGFDV